MLSVDLSVCHSVCESVCLPVCRSVSQLVRQSAYLLVVGYVQLAQEPTAGVESSDSENEEDTAKPQVKVNHSIIVAENEIAQW